MALFNEIQVGRFNRFVQKLLSMKGPPSMPTLATDLQFMHPIFQGLETLYLQSWDVFAFQHAVTALAANGQALELRNPPGSNVVAVVERAFMVEQTAADTANLVFVIGATADQGTLAQARNLDSRGRPQSTCIVSYNQGTAFVAPGGTGFLYNFVSLPANGLFDFLRQGEEVLILPGMACYLQDNVAATQVQYMFRWRERFLEDSERA